MTSRLPRRTAGAFAAALGLFLILTAMVGLPARAGQGDVAAGGHGKPTAAPTTSPQPKSNADMNKGGANNGGDCGAYCSTRDGSDSRNGEGGGEAKGKPCAGCVGKADNKNPQGQAPDATDHNNGYECDGNKGIAKTNPAHTGCTPAPTVSPTVEPSTGPCEPGSSSNPCPPCVPSEGDPCATPTPCVPSEADPCATPTPCVPTEAEPCTTSTPCVPTEAEPCTTPSVSPTETETPCVPTEAEPCVSPSVLPTTVESPAPSISPSVKGVKITRPVVRPRAVVPGTLPTTGNTVPVGLLLTFGFGLIATGIYVTIAPSRR